MITLEKFGIASIRCAVDGCDRKPIAWLHLQTKEGIRAGWICEHCLVEVSAELAMDLIAPPRPKTPNPFGLPNKNQGYGSDDYGTGT